ncbi:phosphatidylinositol 4-phosphate 5-kinase 5-like [Magnolia sinica]|uniref:phosphatidylinositol 4-phosphate 5-kinase 5-like n=1 Tax=Magnolia sinica TaxID=86752 RepID=UPI002659E1F4|nr:phosphatidylinositol 4-phosphate 5-kinase 5-like [Magnolia sinica]
MHHKKSDLQIGKESTCISSDYTTPPHLHPSLPPHIQIHIPESQRTQNQNEIPTLFISTPHKRPIMNQSSSLSHSQTLTSFHSSNSPTLTTKSSSSLANTAFRIVRRLRIHLRLLLLLSLPSLYFFLSNPHRSFLLDFLSAVAFSAALLLSLNLALPRLPSIRLLLRRSFPLKLPCSSTSSSSARRPSTPVLWSIGSRPKSDKRAVSGSCVQVYSNGDVYEGEFHHGKCSGSGVYYYYMSGRYEGDWVDDKYDGYGVETWARGSRYRGQYRQGLRHGFGVYRFYTGDVYAGEWLSGQSHGCGVHTCEDGSRYVGEFKWGVKHGLGHYHFRNGDTYSGEYFADKMHGFGVYCFANGHRYEGAWHEGRRQGLGMYTFRNGETQSGHWQNGVLDTLSTQNTHAGFPVAVNHSKVLNAVQEARRAAEKAFDVARVDERVNKAVAVANKAANAARVAAVKAVQKRTNNGNEDGIPIPIV